LGRASAEESLVAVRKGAGGHLQNIRSAGSPGIAQRLNHDGSCRAAGGDQMLGRGMAEVRDALAQRDAPGGAIGEPGTLGGNLRRKAKRVCGTGDKGPSLGCSFGKS